MAACLLVLLARGQNAAPGAADGVFVRLDGAGTLADGDCIALGAEHRYGGFFLMTSRGENNKLAALDTGAVAPASLAGLTDDCLWRVRLGAGGAFALQSAAGRWLRAKGTGLELAGADADGWRLTPVAGSTFRLSHAATPERALSVVHGPQTISGSDYYFANYLPSVMECDGVAVYRLQASAPGGEATLPADGARVTLVAADCCAGAPGADGVPVALRADSARLHDGRLAPLPNQVSWTCRHTAAGRFLLLCDGGAYLGEGLREAAEPYEWTIAEGRVAPASDSGAGGRRIYYMCGPGAFRLAAADEAADGGAVGAAFAEVAPEAACEYDEATGVARLTGGWTAGALRRFDWRDVRWLDLRALSLPRLCTDFSRQPAGANVPVCVAADAAAHVPGGWRLVLLADGDGLRLMRPAALTDRMPLHLAETFAVGEGQLVYERQAFADGMWETLCLPFDAAVPDGFEAERLAEWRDGRLVFTPTRDIRAGEPLIIRYAGEAAAGTVPFVARSAAGRVAAPSASSPFAGQPDTLRVEAVSGTYLLRAGGDRFVRAAAGSMLLPFRAALQAGRMPVQGVRSYGVTHGGALHRLRKENIQ